MERQVILGTPITPARYLNQVRGSSFCVSYYNRGKVDIEKIINLTGHDSMLLLDNGAYSFWRKNKLKAEPSYWDGYSDWVSDILNRCPQAIAISPDIIDGSESENREMALNFSLCFPIERIMPVWHLNESDNLLVDLIEMGHRYLGMGSTKEFGCQSNPLLHQRLKHAFDVINEATSEGSGYARPWIHMLRFQSISHMYDFNSADSTNAAMNHWRYKNQTNHLYHLTERLKAKARLTECTVSHTPAKLAIESRIDDIRIRHSKAITQSGIYNINLSSELEIIINTPKLMPKEPLLEADIFNLV